MCLSSTGSGAACGWLLCNAGAKGFLQQFQSVTTNAQAPQYSLLNRLNAQSNGTVPTRILCTGHSLGAAVSTLCGIWASQTVWACHLVPCVLYIGNNCVE